MDQEKQKTPARTREEVIEQVNALAVERHWGANRQMIHPREILGILNPWANNELEDQKG